MASSGKKSERCLRVMVWIQWGIGVNLVGRARKCHKTSACNLVVSYWCYRDLIYCCCRPSKYKTPVQHLYNASPTSSTLDKHCANATRVLRAQWEVYKIVHQNHSRKTQDNDPMPGKCWSGIRSLSCVFLVINLHSLEIWPRLSRGVRHLNHHGTLTQQWNRDINPITLRNCAVLFFRVI